MAAWLERISPRINYAWAGTWPAGYIEPPRTLYDHELVVFARGACRLEIGAAALAMGAWSYAIVPPGVVHATVAGADPVLRWCVHFDWTTEARAPIPLYAPLGSRFDPRIARSAPAWVPGGARHGAIADPDPVGATLARLFAHLRGGEPGGRAAGRGALIELLAQLLAPAPARHAGAGRRSTAAGLAEAVKLALDEALNARRAPDEALRRLGRSREHQCRVFQREFGCSPLRYLNAARVDRAMRLLREDPGLAVAAAGRAVGVGDPAYFARLFRRHAGASPREFAAAARAAASGHHLDPSES